jgi:hypothetical protein
LTWQWNFYRIRKKNLSLYCQVWAIRGVYIGQVCLYQEFCNANGR